MVSKTFYLSEGEKSLLLSANVGEGLFFAGQNHVGIKIVAAPFENELITLNQQLPTPTPTSEPSPISEPTQTAPTPQESANPQASSLNANPGIEQ